MDLTVFVGVFSLATVRGNSSNSLPCMASSSKADEHWSDIQFAEGEIPPSIYFGGCSFGAGFYVGVHMAMLERWGPDFHKNVLWSGGSAGAIFAVGLALGKDVEEMNRLYKVVAERSNRHGAVFFASVFMEEAIRELIKDQPQAYKVLQGRCCIGTTTFFDKHRWHVSWVDNEDLVDCVKASCHIPFYCQSNRGMKGTLVVDGAYGFAGTDLPHGDHTLYIGIDPHAEITRHFTNDEMMYPPLDDLYEQMVRSGYLAFKEWDGRMIRKVGRRVPNYAALYILWFLKVFENLWHFLQSALFALFKLLVLLFNLLYHLAQGGGTKVKNESGKEAKAGKA